MLNRLFHIAINSTDLDRSVAFYQRLGFQALQDRSVRNDMVKEAFAVPSGDLRFVHLRLGEDDNATILDIVQWFHPDTEDTGTEPVAQHQRGLTRFSVLTDDTQAVYDELAAEGVEFITKPTVVMTPEGGWKVALVKDPDGVVVQVTELLAAPAAG
ncbi:MULTISPECIES: VOC family protein [unclassified Nocardioides]|uniref:VOC family protein n=1 Tax=unclassified Nocardioides TaxID=2615069 RepID=UPI0000571000|nr:MULTISPECIES: VOC family protein [unclassified Nocardioides]ABL80371.1 Glyoxalase/bleomycin resistance protein/dioxygenase [Nocardioides sp. JS614]MBI2242966.1 VOC family protein [Nocardioides sp.]